MEDFVKENVTSDLYKPIIRLVIALIVLQVIALIIGYLPMLRELSVNLGYSRISSYVIVSSIIYLMMIFVTLNFKKEFLPKVAKKFPNFKEATTITSLILTLIIITFAFNAFKWTSYLLYENEWIYSLVFVLIALIPLFKLCTTLYNNIDKITDLFTGKLAEATGELVACPNCNTQNNNTAKFCKKCGADLNKIIPKTVNKCTNCGKVLEAGIVFCDDCGTKLI